MRRTVPVIAVANQKGGVGKTTNTVCLAAALGEAGKKVLVVDLGPQGSASHGLGHSRNQDENSLFRVFCGETLLEDTICESSAENVYIVPSSGPWLSQLEAKLTNEPGAHMILRKALGTLSISDWDYVFLDTPPSLGFLSISALTAADNLIVAIAPQGESLHGLVDLQHTIRLVKERLNSSLTVKAFIMTQTDRKRPTLLAKDCMKIISREYPDAPIYTVRRDINIPKAWTHQQSVIQHAPNSRATRDFIRIAENF